jgi:tetratricopeptide (TPR) repeat protein
MEHSLDSGAPSLESRELSLEVMETVFERRKVKFMFTKPATHQYFAAFFIAGGLVLGGAACSSQKTALLTEKVAASEKTTAAPNVENAEIEAAQKLIQTAPDAASGYTRLAAAYIRAARRSGDFSLNAKAEAAVNKALEIEPQSLDAQKLRVSLMLTLHRFTEGRALAVELSQKYPRDAFFYGALTDANVELGKYEEAVQAAQKMVDLKPEMAAYARVAQVRSLYGDTAGAIEAITLAANVADPKDAEALAWCLTQLGAENYKIGDYTRAAAAFDAAMKILPDYHLALAGRGRTLAANGDFVNAIKFLQKSQDRVPLTETVISLGDVFLRDGSVEKARFQYQLAETIEQKLGDASDQRRLALLWADADKNLDQAIAIARREYQARQDIYTADILAWCLYRTGEFVEAQATMKQALRLKTQDARLFYHAGMIEKALGNKKAAVEYLEKALKLNPAFDFVQAPIAKLALQELK